MIIPFEAESVMELTLLVGQEVVLTEDYCDDWYKGFIREAEISNCENTRQRKNSLTESIALSHSGRKNSDENITARTEPKIGLFPKNCVEIVIDLPETPLLVYLVYMYIYIYIYYYFFKFL